MPKSENQKLKTLYIAKYFLEWSDENHSISSTDIIDYLSEEYGIEAERHSVYRDIAALRDVYGMDIDSRPGGRFTLLSRDFEYEDLLMLAECVYATRFISEDNAKRIVESLKTLCSAHQAEALESDVYLIGRARTTEKEVLRNLGMLRTAMATVLDGKIHTPTQVTFKYTTRNPNNVNEVIERRKGITYRVSPYKLLINDGNYYLLAYDEDAQKMLTYRVDRMRSIRIQKDGRNGAEAFAALNMSNYTRRVFSMYSGERVRVRLNCSNKVIDAIVEQFGTDGDIIYHPINRARFSVETEVDVSARFYAWVCGFEGKVEIVHPQSVVDGMAAFLEKVSTPYKKKS